MSRDVSAAFVAECLSYDPETGEIRWRERPLEHFASKSAFTTHARTKAGKLAGCIDLSTGYLVIGLSRRILYAHRVAWAIMHGEWPPMQIDHIDGDKFNNCASNLRSVSHADNCRNTTIKSFNRSGAHGVGFAKREGKWRARIMRDYQDIHGAYPLAPRNTKSSISGLVKESGCAAWLGSKSANSGFGCGVTSATRTRLCPSGNIPLLGAVGRRSSYSLCQLWSAS